MAPLALCLLALAGPDEIPRPDRPKSGFVPSSAYRPIGLEGWSIRVNARLIDGDRAGVGREAIPLLSAKLAEVRRSVPPAALARLREVPIWLGVDDGPAPCAEYHPSRDWLVDHGQNPEKARAVEIGCAGRFVAWSASQPSMVLHELAHAYHDRVLGFDHPGIEAAYRAAVDSRRYEAVLRVDGSTARAYALSDPKEFFAEVTESTFGVNDFYPFVRGELLRHDPASAAAVAGAWGVR